MTIRLDSTSLVVTVGASASGKSTWTRRWFRPEQVVSTDALRGIVGESPQDQRASRDAFRLVDEIVAARLTRGLLTVVDSTGLTDAPRRRWVEMAQEHGRPAVAVHFDVAASELAARNRARDRPVPARVVTGQARKTAEVAAILPDEGWRVESPDAVEVVPPEMFRSPEAVARQKADPVRLTFGLSIPHVAVDDGADTARTHLVELARTAEQVGFTSLHVMDHLVPPRDVGPRWQDVHEAMTTLGFLAAVTETIRLGPLVAAVSHRHIPLYGKAIATLDVLSGGRAICGIGAGWSDPDHRLLGAVMPSDDERLDLLEDALRFLPLQWGPGTPPFEGTHLTVPEAICYPRPLAVPRPPIWVGGRGPLGTLRLAAEHADGISLRGDLETTREAIATLHRHCLDADRDPSEVTVTHLADVVVGEDARVLAERMERDRPDDRAPETYAADVNAGTVADHLGRFRAYADVGVDHAIVRFPPAAALADLEAFAPIIDAFR